MGKPQQAPKPQEAPVTRNIEVDATKIIHRLQQQRADLQGQMDILEVALADSQEQVQNLLTRIAELEDGKPE